MTKSIWTGTLTAIVGLAGAGLIAQTTAPQQPPTPQTTTASGADHKVTVTGCLKAAREATTADATGTTGTAGTAGTTGSAGTSGASGAADAAYVLTDASLKPTDTPGATTTPATPDPPTPASPSTTTAGSSGQTYRLIANPSALTPHVGKKLELTGTLENESGSAAAGGASTAGADAKGPALRVESGKVVANSCSQQ